MLAILAAVVPLISQIFGDKGPFGQYLKTKSDALIAENNYRLEVLKSQTERDKAIVEADTSQRLNYLNATSKSFRQGTFYWMSAIIAYSMWDPDNAKIMWANFDLIPEWIQYIYIGMLSVTWGLPVAKENIGLMFSSIGRGLEARRLYKLEKAKIINEALLADVARKALGGQMTQQQWDDIKTGVYNSIETRES